MSKLGTHRPDPPFHLTFSSPLRALVEADVQRARELHAQQFQLVNPRGETLTRDEYLGGIESGRLDYLLWAPVSEIAVRLHGDAAAI